MIFSPFPRNNKTRVSFMQKIFLLAFGLFLCAILLELGLRAGGFILLSFQEHKNAISARQKGAYRILCLGESTTANTWPSILEDILNQKNIGIKFNVIDKGVPGITTPLIVSQLENNLDKYNPDMVIAMMGINDMNSTVNYESIVTKRKFISLGSFRIFKLIKFIHSRIVSKTDKIALAVPEKNNNYVYANDSTCPISLKDINMKTVVADPLAVLGVFDKSLDKKIEKSYLKAIKMYPKTQILYLCLAEFYENRQMNDKAEKTHLKAMEVNSEVYVGYLGLGLLYEHLGNNDRAEEIYKKTIEVNSKTGNKGMGAYYSLSSLYCSQRQYDKAEEVIKKGIAIDSCDGVLYSNLALIYEKQKKYNLAKEYFVKADRIRLRSNNPQTRNSYQKLQEILKQKNVKLVLVQYPLRNIKYLKKMVDERDGIVFVDNELIFKKTLKTSEYKDYFIDSFAGDFGHCTQRGYELLAKNIADTILKDVFNKKP